MKRWFRNFFVPSEENGFLPNSLEKRAITIMLLLVISTFSLGSLQSLMTISSNWFISAILPGVLIDLTNTERTDGTLGTVKESAVLDKAAQLKANDMAEKGYFAHNTPEGHTPWYWFDMVGYDYVYAGENLAVHFTDSEDVVQAWMRSPGHRANIMKSEYTEIGIGTAKGVYKGAPTVFVVQLFGTPRSDTVPNTASVGTKNPSATPDEVATLVGAPAPVSVTPRVLAEETPKTTAEAVRTNHIVTSSSSKPIASSTISTTTPTEPVTPVPATPFGESVLVSDMATTSALAGSLALRDSSTGGSSPDGGVSRPLEFFNRLLSSPRMVMGIIYLLLASFAITSLASAMLFAWRRHSVVHVAYSAGLVVAMFLLFYVHVAITGGALIV